MGNFTRIFGLSFIIQAMIQILGVVTGIYLVRQLSIDEYAFYTLANTILSTMLILSDGGLNSSILRRGGQVYKNKEDLSITIKSGLKLRKFFSIITVIVVVPILIGLLKYHNASNLFVILITLSVIITFYSTLTNSIYEIPLKLHQNIFSLQTNQLYVNFLRLILSVILIIIFPFAYIAILATGLPRILGNILLRLKNRKYILENVDSDAVILEDLKKDVKKILPTSIYYCVSGQIIIYIISIFGNTQNLANYGALTRVSSLLAIFTSIFSIIMIPKFAKMGSDKKLLRSRFIKNQIILFFICVFFTFLVYLFDDEILLVLGNNYQCLNKELLLIFIMSCIFFMSGISSSLMNSRSIIMSPTYFIGFSLLIQFLSLLFFDLKTIRGVVLYGICTSLIIYLMRIIYFYYYLKVNYVSKN